MNLFSNYKMYIIWSLHYSQKVMGNSAKYQSKCKSFDQ